MTDSGLGGASDDTRMVLERLLNDHRAGAANHTEVATGASSAS
jgi:hypothetical protein